MERNSVVVSGSFRKHLREIRLCIKELKESGYDVLSPRSAKASGSKNGFVILETDESDDPRALERSHLAAIAGADALYVC
ncbi:MAG: hypothetical protein KGH57_04800, partial [Candidatus Micrarchaeota archaeon]|nr:hypothetical protein [Candidatus Micrarchaeota archaeon]